MHAGGNPWSTGRAVRRSEYILLQWLHVKVQQEKVGWSRRSGDGYICGCPKRICFLASFYFVFLLSGWRFAVIRGRVTARIMVSTK